MLEKKRQSIQRRQELEQQADELLRAAGRLPQGSSEDAYTQREQPVVSFDDDSSVGLDIRHAHDKARARHLHPTALGYGNEAIRRSVGDDANRFRPVEEEVENDLD